MSKMKKLQPEMEKHQAAACRDDRMKQQEAMMELYKREKVSPAGRLSAGGRADPGVLRALQGDPTSRSRCGMRRSSVGSSDLSAPDPTSLFNLFGLIPWTPPHILMIGVLPLIMGVTMWVQMRLNPPPPDPVQAQMFNYMPLIFTFMLATFPAGLVHLLGVEQFAVDPAAVAASCERTGCEVDLLGNIRNSLPFLKRKSESRSGA